MIYPQYSYIFKDLLMITVYTPVLSSELISKELNYSSSFLIKLIESFLLLWWVLTIIGKF